VGAEHHAHAARTGAPFEHEAAGDHVTDVHVVDYTADVTAMSVGEGAAVTRRARYAGGVSARVFMRGHLSRASLESDAEGAMSKFNLERPGVPQVNPVPQGGAQPDKILMAFTSSVQLELAKKTSTPVY